MLPIEIGAKHETIVTANPVKIYKSKIDYLNDMEVKETRPKRKSYGSFISPGPYQKPLSIAIPPLTTGTSNVKAIVVSYNEFFLCKHLQISKKHLI